MATSNECPHAWHKCVLNSCCLSSRAALYTACFCSCKLTAESIDLLDVTCKGLLNWIIIFSTQKMFWQPQVDLTDWLIGWLYLPFEHAIHRVLIAVLLMYLEGGNCSVLWRHTVVDILTLFFCDIPIFRLVAEEIRIQQHIDVLNFNHSIYTWKPVVAGICSTYLGTY